MTARMRGQAGMGRRGCLRFFCAGLAFAGLAACGRKNQPEYPEGSTYPNTYPYVPPARAQGAPAPQPSAQAPADEPPEDRGLWLRPNTGYGR